MKYVIALQQKWTRAEILCQVLVLFSCWTSHHSSLNVDFQQNLLGETVNWHVIVQGAQNNTLGLSMCLTLADLHTSFLQDGRVSEISNAY
jgi:hypothetical protein